MKLIKPTELYNTYHPIWDLISQELPHLIPGGEGNEYLEKWYKEYEELGYEDEDMQGIIADLPYPIVRMMYDCGVDLGDSVDFKARRKNLLKIKSK